MIMNAAMNMKFCTVAFELAFITNWLYFFGLRTAKNIRNWLGNSVFSLCPFPLVICFQPEKSDIS